jgi:hypothetical protein
MKNVSDKSFLYSITSLKNQTFYQIMWKNTVELGGTQMTIWGMGIACWVPQATNTRQKV